MNNTRSNVIAEIIGFGYLEKPISKLSNDEIDELVKSLNSELLMSLASEQLTSSLNSTVLEFLENDVEINEDLNNILNVYDMLAKISKEELHKSINFHWFARWDDFLNVGNLLTRPDSTDFVEVTLRLEEEFDLQMGDDGGKLEDIGSTVRYIWNKIKGRDKTFG